MEKEEKSSLDKSLEVLAKNPANPRMLHLKELDDPEEGFVVYLVQYNHRVKTAPNKVECECYHGSERQKCFARGRGFYDEEDAEADKRFKKCPARKLAEAFLQGKVPYEQLVHEPIR
jgi:hypothetical protein